MCTTITKMKCLKEIVTVVEQAEQDDDCDVCFVLGVDECCLHRTTKLHKFDQAIRDCLPIRRTSMRIACNGVFFKTVFSNISNRWILVNEDVRRDRERFLQANST